MRQNFVDLHLQRVLCQTDDTQNTRRRERRPQLRRLGRVVTMPQDWARGKTKTDRVRPADSADR